MNFPKKQHLLLHYITFTVFILCLLLFSCQGSKQDKQDNQLLSMALPQNEDSLQQLPPPLSLSPDSARLLGKQLDSIFHYLHKKKGFNGTVLVTKSDQVVYRGAFGYADFHRKDTLSLGTAFQLASVSKQFTAMAIMMLKEQGRLQYDDSVQQFIPAFPYKGITIRQLLTHRSGLSNYTYFSEQVWPDRKMFMTNEDVLKMMAEHKPEVYYQPNTHFDYSNTGYALLASIVEKVSGLPFATFLQQNIFSPLQMEHTFTFGDSIAAARVEKVAIGHTGGKRKRSSDYLDTVLGDKGLYSTVEDLYKWDQALYTEKLIKKETLEEAFTGSRFSKKKTKKKTKKKEDYGFGWRILPLENGDTAVFHAGLWHGYNTYLFRNPSDHSGFIILSNLPNGSLKHVKDDIQQFLYPPKPIQFHHEQQNNVASAQL